MRRRTLQITLTTAAVAAALALSSIAQAQDETKEEYRALAVNMGGGPTGATTTLLVTITRWSTNEERMMLLNTLKEKGHDEFMKALRKQKESGFVRGTGRGARANPFPSTRLHGAWQLERNGQFEIVLVAERNISGAEAASASRSMDYDTTVVTMQFPDASKEGKGTGMVHGALKLRYNSEKEKLEVEKLGSGSFRLTEITKEN